MKWQALAASVCLIVASGCAVQPVEPVSSVLQDIDRHLDCRAQPMPEQRVELELSDTLAASQRHYAALAQLQKSVQPNTEYWSRYAQLLAQTGDMAQGREVFQKLSMTCGSPEASHGLGLIAIREGRLDEAWLYMNEAVRKLPASADVRNDTGYVAMLLGEYGPARFHLQTALELNNGRGRARQNLAILYHLSGDQQALNELSRRYHLDQDELDSARSIAQQLRK